MKQKRLIMMLAVLAAAGAAMAQGNGQAGITEATQLVTGYFDPGTKLVYACNLQIFLCLFLEKLNMPQNTPVTKAS